MSTRPGPPGSAPATASWWAELAWLGGPDATPAVRLDVAADGTLAAVTPGAPRPASGVLPGLTLPGLVNAHSHAFHRALRGWTHAGGGTFWTWRERMYAVAGRLDPDTYLSLATAAYAEMVLAGITTVGEFHYLHHDPAGRPYPHAEMEAAVIEAATRAGLRITLLDTCYLAGGIGRPLAGVQRRFGDGDAGRWAARVDGRVARLVAGRPGARLGAALHSVRAVPPGSLGEVASWARHARAPLHAHLSEQPAENDDCVAAYGRTPARLLADHGVLSPAFTAVHATHLTGDDVALLGGAGAGVCMCPTTERDLADGIGPAAALAAAGSPLSLGSDSHAVVDLFEDARGVELDERLAGGRRGVHDPASLLVAATAGGAEALGWSGGGRLAAGAPADWCTLDLGSPALAGTVGARGANAAAAAVFAGRAADVTHVVVGGRPVVSDRRHLALGDVGAALGAAIGALWGEA